MVDKYMQFENLIDNFCNKLNGKKVFIWGYGAQGRIIEEYFIMRGRQIEAIIDDMNPSPKGVKRHYILNQYEPSTVFVLIAVAGNVENIKQILEDMGIKSHAVVRELFYKGNEFTVDFFKWIEEHTDINFTGEEKELGKIQSGNPYGFIYGVDIKKYLVVSYLARMMLFLILGVDAGQHFLCLHTVELRHVGEWNTIRIFMIRLLKIFVC